METTTPIYITEPLVDEDLLVLDTDAAKKFISETEDENKQYDVHLSVMSKEMIPTAVLFALKPRLNTTFHVTIGSSVSGATFVYSLLRSSHIEDVMFEGTY